MINRSRTVFALTLLIAGCSSSTASEPDPKVMKAPSFIPFPSGLPASVFWDDHAQVLYIGDNQNNQIWKWTDAGGLAEFATTPDPGGELDA